jgi:hypothetical protein
MRGVRTEYWFWLTALVLLLLRAISSLTRRLPDDDR